MLGVPVGLRDDPGTGRDHHQGRLGGNGTTPVPNPARETSRSLLEDPGQVRVQGLAASRLPWPGLAVTHAQDQAMISRGHRADERPGLGLDAPGSLTGEAPPLPGQRLVP